MLSALKHMARPAATRVLTSPASGVRLSCGAVSASAVTRREAQQSRPKSQLVPTSQNSVRLLGQQHRRSNSKAHAAAGAGAESWQHSSKTVSAADAADLGQESEVDAKTLAYADGTAGTDQEDFIDKTLRLFRLQPLEPEERPKVLCEFFTQAAFNFMSCGAVAMAKTYAGSDAMLTMGLIMAAHLVLLPVMIFTAGPISGAHFNPMVTSVFVMARMQSLSSGICYVIAQCLGGIFGAAGAFYSLPANMQVVGFAGVQGVPMDRTVMQAFLGEIYASFFFVFVLFGMVVDKRGWGRYGPFAVPLAICLDMWVLGPVSSMCINPARALGPAVVTGFWENHWLWWTAPFIGGLTAGKLYTRFWMPRDQMPAAAKAAAKKLL